MKWILIALLVGLAGWYVADHAGGWKDRFVPRKLRVVEPGKIYASGQINQHLIRGVLEDNHIKTIISLSGIDPQDADKADVDAEKQAVKEMGIEWLDFPLAGDGTGDIKQYAGAVAAMVDSVKAGKPILLHCSSGAQRSNGATFYYRVLIQGWNADQAAAEMIRNGHDPHHNPVMIPYLNQHMAELAQLLVEKGIMQKVPTPLPQIHGLP